MSKKSEAGVVYNNVPAPAHIHQVAELEGEGSHLAPHEQSRHKAEHTANGHSHEPQVPTVGHGISAFGHREIEALAHQLWEQRGGKDGTPEGDWFKAAEILRSKAHTA